LDAQDIEFNHKLHVIYLINDIVHHCVRKSSLDLQQALETVIVQVFYNVYSSDISKKDQLIKVLNIWETQKYFSEVKLDVIRNILKENNLPQAPPTTDTFITKGGVAPPPPPWIQKPFGGNPIQGPPPHLPPWQQAPPPLPPQSWDGQPPPGMFGYTA
jgi:calcium homeostasis ER protein